MALTSSKTKPRKTLANVRTRAFRAKKARKLLAAGRKSLNQIEKETGIPRSTLSDMRKKNLSETVYSPAERQKITIQVLNYVHSELLKKTTTYVRRPRSKRNLRIVVSYNEVKQYLESHWKTAHPNRQLGLQCESWIPSRRSYGDLRQIISSSSSDRRRERGKQNQVRVADNGYYD